MHWQLTQRQLESKTTNIPNQFPSESENGFTADPLNQMETKATCCYCGVGCGVIVESDGKQITGVRGDPDHPANFGRLCTKGSTLHLTAKPVLQQQARALYPEMRVTRNGMRERASWNECLDFVAQKFSDTIRAHGPDSVGFYISGQLLTEDYYVFNKLARFADLMRGQMQIDQRSILGCAGRRLVQPLAI